MQKNNLGKEGSLLHFCFFLVFAVFILNWSLPSSIAVPILMARRCYALCKMRCFWQFKVLVSIRAHSFKQIWLHNNIKWLFSCFAYFESIADYYRKLSSFESWNGKGCCEQGHRLFWIKLIMLSHYHISHDTNKRRFSSTGFTMWWALSQWLL